MDTALSLSNLLTATIGSNPAALTWPADFSLTACGHDLTATYDPHNALITLFGACSADLAAASLSCLLTAGQQEPELCSRVLILAADDAADRWRELGFRAEGVISDYWTTGKAAMVWALAWGERATPSPELPVVAATSARRSTLPTGWFCRAAELADAVAIGDLLRIAFPDYPIPEDPGAIRYALASGAVHGRVICRPDDRLAAYASAEFQPGGGAVELTDCATAPDACGRGLMTHLVTRLCEDMEDVFDGCSTFSRARVDQPAMAGVLAACGWRRTGRLVGHYRVGAQWLSADLWQAPSADQAES